MRKKCKCCPEVSVFIVPTKIIDNNLVCSELWPRKGSFHCWWIYHILLACSGTLNLFLYPTTRFFHLHRNICCSERRFMSRWSFLLKISGFKESTFHQAFLIHWLEPFPIFYLADGFSNWWLQDRGKVSASGIPLSCTARWLPNGSSALKWNETGLSENILPCLAVIPDQHCASDIDLMIKKWSW